MAGGVAVAAGEVVVDNRVPPTSVMKGLTNPGGGRRKEVPRPQGPGIPRGQEERTGPARRAGPAGWQRWNPRTRTREQLARAQGRGGHRLQQVVGLHFDVLGRVAPSYTTTWAPGARALIISISSETSRVPSGLKGNPLKPPTNTFVGVGAEKGGVEVVPYKLMSEG